MENAIQYRPVNVEEAASVCKFGEQEMVRTFKHLYNEKDLADYVSEDYTEGLYTSWISNEQYIVNGAYTKSTSGDDVMVGYILAGPCKLPITTMLPFEGNDTAIAEPSGPEEVPPGEIKRLYVHPSVFGTGVAEKLLIDALKQLRSNPGTERRSIYLGVYSENPRAQKFYKRYNFKFIGEYKFMVGEQADREFIMKNTTV